ncbi:MAG: ATP synthase F1 subunit gamma [candidate division Zixibacteria bacterium]|nr:ATP synthase F1 subunit gamma [candidate division Zixibacteria bacterium]
MATLREVKKRIKTVVSTRRITSAMEMVAASKLRRAQQKIEQTRPYSQKMDEMLQHLAAGSSGDISHPFFEQRDPKKRTLVLVTSDRGLCGSFNSNVIRRAVNWLREEGLPEVEIVTVGKKGNDLLKSRQWEIINNFSDWGGQLNYSKAQDLVDFLTQRFVSGETDSIHLVYTQFISTVKYKIVIEPYLPLTRPESGEGAGIRSEYIFEPTPESIYESLMPSYALTKMVTVLVDSFAAEHGSRMVAMGNATSNAGEMVDDLTLLYNKTRQAQITKELLEVISGAEALK